MVVRTSDEVLRVARSMVTDFDEIVGEITERVWRTVPAYPQILLDQAELREQVHDSILNVLVCLAEARSPSEQELAAAARNGERRALQGVAQAAVIQSYRSAERSLVETFQARCARMQVPLGVLRSGQQAIVEVLDQLEAAMVQTYLAMQHRIATRTVLTEPDLMNRLVSGEPIAPGDLARLVQTLGLPIDEGTRMIGVAVGLQHAPDDRPGDGGPARRLVPDPGPGAGATLADQLATVRHHAVTHLHAVTGQAPLSGVVREDGHSPVVVLAVPYDGATADLARRLELGLDRRRLLPGTVAAVGEPRRGLAQAGGSCRQAIGALRVAWQRGTAREVLTFADVLLEVLVMRDPRMVVNLQDRYLSPLLPHKHLLETLRCYLETDLSVPESARRLFVHSNTVAYRLRRISELSGLDLHRVKDLARVVVAVQGLELGISAESHGSAALTGAGASDGGSVDPSERRHGSNPAS